MGARSQVRDRLARVGRWSVVVAMVAGASLMMGAVGSGASEGGRGIVCVTNAAARGQSCADLGVTVTHQPNPVQIGHPFQMKVAVQNFGPTTAFSKEIQANPPASMTFVSFSASSGVSCTTPAVGSPGSSTCSLPPVASGSTLKISIVVRPTRTGTFPLQANELPSGTTDPNSGNDSDSHSVVIHTNTRGCTIIGTVGDDTITGTPGDDLICGLQGVDHLDGGAGNDTLYGQRGADVLNDHDGTDRLIGGPGDDSLDAQDGVGGDTVNGSEDTDTCAADPGDTVRNC